MLLLIEQRKNGVLQKAFSALLAFLFALFLVEIKDYFQRFCCLSILTQDLVHLASVSVPAICQIRVLLLVWLLAKTFPDR